MVRKVKPMAPFNEKEIKEIVRLIVGVERHSEENEAGFDEQLKVVDEILKDFNKKYPGISLILERNTPVFTPFMAATTCIWEVPS